jgi:hypothetical protein
MITVNDFEKLNLDQKAFKLSDEGMLLQSMKSNDTFLSLYYFPRFFQDSLLRWPSMCREEKSLRSKPLKTTTVLKNISTTSN